MKIIIDASAIVEIDRKNEEVIKLIKSLIDEDCNIMVSTVTISEILTGSYLTRDFRKSLSEAKRILGQFIWVDLDEEIAEKTAQYMAYLISNGKLIEYPDVVIAATFKIMQADYLLTLNKAHFQLIPDLKDKVYEPKEFARVK